MGQTLKEQFSINRSNSNLLTKEFFIIPSISCGMINYESIWKSGSSVIKLNVKARYHVHGRKNEPGKREHR